MTCPFMHKRCKVGCDNYVCRAFFPEKQPFIQKTDEDICLGEDHATECLIYVEAVKWREERRLKGLTEHCPFATNNRCGRPWEWRCDAVYPFLLTPYEIKEGTRDIPVRDEKGEIKFLPVDYDINETCLSGDVEIYEACPLYKNGLVSREGHKKLKSKETHE